MHQEQCPVCDGTGNLRRGLECPRCYGDGIALRTECDGCGTTPAVLIDAHGNVLCDKCSDDYCCELCEARKRAESTPQVVEVRDTEPCPPPPEALLVDALTESLELIEAAKGMKLGLRRALRIGRAAVVRR